MQRAFTWLSLVLLSVSGCLPLGGVRELGGGTYVATGRLLTFGGGLPDESEAVRRANDHCARQAARATVTGVSHDDDNVRVTFSCEPTAAPASDHEVYQSPAPRQPVRAASGVIRGSAPLDGLGAVELIGKPTHHADHIAGLFKFVDARHGDGCDEFLFIVDGERRVSPLRGRRRTPGKVTAITVRLLFSREQLRQLGEAGEVRLLTCGGRGEVPAATLQTFREFLATFDKARPVATEATAMDL